MNDAMVNDAIVYAVCALGGLSTAAAVVLLAYNRTLARVNSMLEDKNAALQASNWLLNKALRDAQQQHEG